jgi:hypothetical protein
MPSWPFTRSCMCHARNIRRCFAPSPLGYVLAGGSWSPSALESSRRAWTPTGWARPCTEVVLAGSNPYAFCVRRGLWCSVPAKRRRTKTESLRRFSRSWGIEQRRRHRGRGGTSHDRESEAEVAEVGPRLSPPTPPTWFIKALELMAKTLALWPQLTAGVCAGHGTELTGCKSPCQVFAEPKARSRTRASPRGDG